MKRAPLLVRYIALVLFWRGTYQTGYATLFISTVLALAAFAVAPRFFPHPSPPAFNSHREGQRITKPYWLNMAAGRVSPRVNEFGTDLLPPLEDQW